MLIGYARTSTVEQIAGLEAQERDLKAAGVEKVFREQVSSVAPRPQLEAMAEFAREGDVVIVTKLDRLARSVRDLMAIVDRLTAKSVGLRILAMNMDTGTPTGKLMLTILGGVAEFERELMLERQREGIAKAKAEKKYKGRAPTARARVAEIGALLDQGVGPQAISERLGISRSSVYRVIEHAGIGGKTAARATTGDGRAAALSPICDETIENAGHFGARGSYRRHATSGPKRGSKAPHGSAPGLARPATERGDGVKYLSFRIDSTRHALTGWRYFWAKSVDAFDPEVHCARCLIGPYIKEIRLQAPVNEDVALQRYAPGAILYFCGGATPTRWANNLHLAVRVTGDRFDEASIEAYTGDRLTITGAVPIPFSDGMARKHHGHRDESFLTCRNFQFGAAMVARDLLPLHVADRRLTGVAF